MPKISIIVPVYNVDKYIHECIDSIMAQSFTDWELLLVDDGSSDNSGIICDGYRNIDCRIRVFHKCNGGVSSARNIGLDNAKGEWVTFIDSDDFVSSSFLEGLIKPIFEHSEIDFVHGGCTNTKDGNPIGINQKYEDYYGTDYSYVLKNIRGLPFSKLFLLSRINQGIEGCPLRFDENMRIAEDMAFTIDYLLMVNKYAFVSETGYFYRIDNSSSATKVKRKPDYKQELHSFNHLYASTHRFIVKNGIKDRYVLRYRYGQLAENQIQVILILYQQDYSISEIKKRLQTDFPFIRQLSGYFIKRKSYIIWGLIRIKFHYVLKFFYKLKKYGSE